jgi:hypothetical protein
MRPVGGFRNWIAVHYPWVNVVRFSWGRLYAGSRWLIGVNQFLAHHIFSQLAVLKLEYCNAMRISPISFGHPQPPSSGKRP